MNVVGLTPIIPIVFAFALPLTSIIVKGNKKIIQMYALLGTGLTLLATCKLFKITYAAEKPLIYTFGGWNAPVGIIYEVDKMSALLALVTAVLMFLIAIYSYRYLEREGGLEWYYTLYLGLEAGLLGVLLTGDAFNLFVMIEVTSIAAYALVMYYNARGDSIYAGLKYAFIGAIGTTMYFLALGVIYYAFGTLNMANLSAIIHGINFPIANETYYNIAVASGIVLALASWAFLIKAAIVPNHFWLPEAHPAAPSPVSAILSGLVVNVGIYSLARFLYTIYGGQLSGQLGQMVHIISTIIITLGAVSALFGALMMNVQRDIKRLIAYSTIMHMGYLAMAVGAGTQLALQAAVFHMVNHAVAKALLFLAAGVFVHAAGSRNINDLAGLGRKMPLATFSLAIASLSLVGIPPLNVFFSKLLLFNAFMEKSFVLALILVLSSIIALVAYIRVLYEIWLGKRTGVVNVKEPISMSTVCLLLAIASIALGLLAPYIIEHYINPAVNQTVDYELYIRAALESAVKLKLS
ncbi:proton-conducting transporter transmembrane domain-containing protein [Pyrococcus yayanosii]|uniref:Membrane bound complex 1, subunit A n=1 Tax=Pyrococcus yayanosii (strain CH1 / JCM 16557) TaxID=529709 RepID=F8AEW7_PYRYC|nr:proton-conducting transporter membrane subunit [Pyrococcus yayanosii]AEH24801.1 Membrane bound complex 1, subunit A [Pyrococcus yayanosii CH1]